MSALRRLRLYASQFDRAVLALTIDLADDGKVSFTPGEDGAAAEFLMNRVGKGAFVREAPYVVRPEAGEAYLDAVASSLSRTSRWLVVAE